MLQYYLQNDIFVICFLSNSSTIHKEEGAINILEASVVF